MKLSHSKIKLQCGKIKLLHNKKSSHNEIKSLHNIYIYTHIYIYWQPIIVVLHAGLHQQPLLKIFLCWYLLVIIINFFWLPVAVHKISDILNLAREEISGSDTSLGFSSKKNPSQSENNTPSDQSKRLANKITSSELHI